VIELDFTEPVSVLQVILLSSDVPAQELPARSEGSLLSIELPAGVSEGGHAVTWRVVSEDGHPVGGTLSFTVGSGGPSLGVEARASLGQGATAVGLELARAAMFIALFFGVGGAASQVTVGSLPRSSILLSLSLVLGGSLASIAIVGLQGADLSGTGLGALAAPATWSAGLASNYGRTSLLALVSFLIAGAALHRSGTLSAGCGAAVAVIVACVAICTSGHASSAEPHWLTRAALGTHIATISFWIGALQPLYVLLSAGGDRSRYALVRFSRAIPYAVVPLLLSGAVLAAVQLGTPGPAWLSPYGLILAGKLLVVGLVLCIACYNRFALTEPASAGDPVATGRLRSAVLLEIGLIVLILFLTAGWRFATPPRAVASPAVTTMTGHTDKVDATMDIDYAPDGIMLSPKLVLPSGKPAAALAVVAVIHPLETGLLPIEVPFHEMGAGRWMAMNPVPLGALSQWQVELRIRIGDFETVDVPMH
jgi:copper transport protein